MNTPNIQQYGKLPVDKAINAYVVDAIRMGCTASPERMADAIDTMAVWLRMDSSRAAILFCRYDFTLKLRS